MKTGLRELQNEIQFKFPELEEQRLKSKKYYDTGIGLIIIGLIAFVYLLVTGESLSKFLAFFGLLIYILIIHFLTKPRLAYENYFNKIKQPFLYQLLSLIEKSIEYKDHELPLEEIQETQLFKERYIRDKIVRIEDYFEGCYRNVNFKVMEIDFGYSNTHKVDAFKPSVLFIADFNKRLKFQTFVKEYNFFNKYNNDKRDTNIITSPRGHKLTLENTDFEYIFQTHATDEIEGRYVLSFSIMEKILSIKENLGDKSKLYISFLENKVSFLLYNKKNFEPVLTSSISNDKTFERFYKEIKQILEIIDELKLNEKIWS